ncbi:ras guanine-nucleotide exchange protein-like protein [Westerdykella ornata]|uniref:Ras guanine-nucleotide exchange protein-like protein n=1 Tax=Westerdykella ornata TaxID=318751 RepID=A0A6A6JPI4_WESOR|nr:ras guanine-nucleotide exchange protein-like protein [Westerdykella ornata]KAF2278053.1 ras guanine-nucleotide exchange protein-like protein [Westerdykella ornata]
MDDFTLETVEGNKHASALVAPLNIQKSPNKSRNPGGRHTRQSSSHGTASIASQSHSQSQPSPPLTPRTSNEALPEAQAEAQSTFQPVFHDYLRAFYPYHPTSTVSSSTDESSITVPINQGDVILVHSVHPNGWADGTLLASGARGWLPTNYCEAYDHPTIRNLLNALTHLFDLVRDAENGELVVFTKQDYVRSMIAGVRCFLERTQCLTRDAPLIVAHVGLRRMRKGLLGDLSSLVKTAKKLQESVQANDPSLPIYDLLDELVLKAFKLVTRAVRFLDIWAQDSVSLTLDLADTRNTRPPTPPSDSLDPSVQPPSAADEHHNHGAAANDYAPSASHADAGDEESSTSLPQRNLNRLSVAFSIPSESDSIQSPILPPQPQGQAKRLSVTHRLSYTGKSQSGRKQNLASERLNSAHDAFLGFIGSFIGLHLQSRSSDELIHTTKQSVIACRHLLAVVDEVWERDSRRSEQLEHARDAMYARLTELVQATKDMFSTIDAARGEEVVMPDSGKQLVAAATSCVRSAGDCVSKARNVIERIGDFEFEHAGFGLSDAVMEQFGQIAERCAEHPEPCAQFEPAVEKDKPLPAPPSDAPQPLPLVVSESKPLPEVPLPSPPAHTPPASIEPQPTQNPVLESPPTTASFRLSRSSITPAPHLIQPSPSDYSQSPASATQRFFSKPFGADSVNASVADSSSAHRYSMRCDTGSVASQTSTRATTPDQSPAKMNSSQTLVGSCGSSSELRSLASEDVAAVEERLLGTTFAHELIYNKEGQISGGSLPALVEQLTMPDATPDSTFVTTFFLTFRLFTTPVELAECLIARFDYVGDSASMGTPVRLRIYNVFKGWLESHWLPESDSVALGVIISFATNKLRAALPSAGKRLAELTAKVTEVHAGALVPRLASSIGKGGAYTAFTTADSNVPTPIITKSQLGLLRNAKDGKSQCSILDFDPLELARQFTIIESKLFCAIQPEELLASEWTKKNGSKAVNVRAMSTLSTDLTNLVTDTILSLEDPKKRAVTIKQWVKVAQKCLELNNYDSLMAIICSLNSSMVLRLAKTWELVSAKTKGRLDELKTITDVGRNYAVLRQRLQNHMAPCIPFVGIYLTDLTFVDVGNGSTRQLPSENGREGASVINFDKHMKTAKIIGQLQSFQVPYRLAAVPEMQDWMDAQIQRVRASDHANVQSYYRRSLFLEPRENSGVAKATAPTAEGTSGLSGSNRNSSKERFDFLNFTFVPANASKDR